MASALLTLISLILVNPRKVDRLQSMHARTTRHVRDRRKQSNEGTTTGSLHAKHRTKDQFPTILAVRLPFIILALHQQLFLRPSTPYYLDNRRNGRIEVLYSEMGSRGRVVVHSDESKGWLVIKRGSEIVGGRWMSRARRKGLESREVEVP